MKFRIWLSPRSKGLPRPDYSADIEAPNMEAAKHKAKESPYWTGEIQKLAETVNDPDVVQRVYLRFAYSKDPKSVVKEFDKLRDALKSLETAYTKNYDLTENAPFHSYTQAVDAYRNIKFFLEHAGGSVAHAKALLTLSKNPFIPANAVAENPKVFKDGLGEVDALEREFEKLTKAAA